MPQPATHYLVTRFAIPENYYSDWWDNFKSYFGLGSSGPDLFYFPLMPAKIIGNIRDDLSWYNIAAPLHSYNSYNMFCNLLNIAKQNKLSAITIPEKENAKKQFAFSFGYYCHVITDCIFHPYIYRSAGDFWHTTDKASELRHKQQELFIDNELYNKYYPKKENIEKMKIECNEKSSDLLDFAIANFFNDALLKTYPDILPRLNDESPKEKSHPIQQAYNALTKTIPFLFEGTKICLWGNKVTIDVDFSNLISKFSKDFLTLPYRDTPSLPNCSPDDLFKFSILECYNVFKELIKFWNSNQANSAKFFRSNFCNYLGAGNFNLDTGLPAHLNNCKKMRIADFNHYFFKSDILANNYKYFKEDYINLNKSILINKRLI